MNDAPEAASGLADLLLTQDLARRGSTLGGTRSAEGEREKEDLGEARSGAFLHGSRDEGARGTG